MDLSMASFLERPESTNQLDISMHCLAKSGGASVRSKAGGCLGTGPG